MFVEKKKPYTTVFNTDFILSVEKASKLWLQICGWSRGGLSSAVSWSADSLRACWAGDAELGSSWVWDLGACTSYPERNDINFQRAEEEKNNILSISDKSEGREKARGLERFDMWLKYILLNFIHSKRMRCSIFMHFVFSNQWGQCKALHVNISTLIYKSWDAVLYNK